MFSPRNANLTPVAIVAGAAGEYGISVAHALSADHRVLVVDGQGVSDLAAGDQGRRVGMPNRCASTCPIPSHLGASDNSRKSTWVLRPSTFIALHRRAGCDQLAGDLRRCLG